MNYVMWRLHRNQIYVASGLLAALIVVTLISGIRTADDYHVFLATCAATHSCNDPHLFRAGDGTITDLAYATMVIPLLFGLFWGAPLLAREFEDGTHNLAWTQTVTRWRWLSRNLLWALLAAALWGAAVAALVSWWRRPENALGTPTIRMATGTFDIQGIVPAAYSVFAVAVGTALGAVFKRILPALATTLGVFVGLRYLIAIYVRPHYLAPLSRIATFGEVNDIPPTGDLVLANSIIGPGGKRYGDALDPAWVPAACNINDPPSFISCMTSYGFRSVTLYQPAGRFWAFQFIEAGIFVVLAAAMVALTYRIVLTRDA